MPTPIPAGLTLGAVEPKEAFAAFARRGLLRQSYRWQDVWQAEHARAFTVAGVMRDDVLKIFQDELRTSLAEGRSLLDFKDRITSQLTGKGFWGDVQVTDPATGETRVSRFDDRRLRLIYDVNLRQSAAAGRWARIERNKAMFPLVLYRTQQDERVRASHAAWNGLALPVDDAWWQTHYPPNGWRCRCIAFATNEKDLQRRANAGEVIKRQAPPKRWVDYVNPHTDEVRAVPAGIDPGFGYNPGRAGRDHLAHAGQLQAESIAQLEPRLGAAAAQAMPEPARQVVADGYRGWLADIQAATADRNARRARPGVGTLAPAEVTWLADRGAGVPGSAVIRVTANLASSVLRDATVPDEVLRQLPELLRSPLAVLYDAKADTLVYVLPDPAEAGQAIAVRVKVGAAGGSSGNPIKTVGRAALSDLVGQLASAALQLVRGSLG